VADHQKENKIKGNGIFSRVIGFRALYLMVLPLIIHYMLFFYLPMYGVTLAFKDFNTKLGILGSSWAGLKYFEQVFTDGDFLIPLRNTIVISFLKLLFAFPAPIILALLLNEIQITGFKRSVQTVLYLPRFLSWTIAGGLLFNLLSVNGGIVIELMKFFGKEPVNFMTDDRYIRTILVASTIWKEAGWGMIIYLAALSSVNSELYEVAMIDGANRWGLIRHVSLPSIKSTIVLVLILSVSGLLNGNFEQVYVLSNPLLFDKADIIDTYVFRAGIQGGRISYSAAIGLSRSIVSVILLLSANYSAKLLGEDSIF